MDHRAPYRHVRGFNYVPSTARNPIEFWRDYDEAVIERELSFAQRLGFNNARVFLAYVAYAHAPQVFLERVRHFVRSAHDRGIDTMPVVWDSCFSEVEPTYDLDSADWIPNPGVQRLGPDFWPEGERYCTDLVQKLGPEPGLAMWDVMNEPLMTSYVWGPTVAALAPSVDREWVDQHELQKQQRTDEIWRFVRHFCGVLKVLDVEHPLTVGVAYASQLGDVCAFVDVLSFHDYRPTRARIRAHIDEALQVASERDKPIFVSEIGCPARANPYDVSLEVFQGEGIGWYLWELMIGSSRWRDIHGLVYPDGTIRDPSVVAAVRGFFRKRSGPVIPINVGKEKTALSTISQTREWLGLNAAEYHQGLELLEMLANLLEAGEHVPMNSLPSGNVLALRVETPQSRGELASLLAQWSDQLERRIGEMVHG